MALTGVQNLATIGRLAGLGHSAEEARNYSNCSTSPGPPDAGRARCLVGNGADWTWPRG